MVERAARGPATSCWWVRPGARVVGPGGRPEGTAVRDGHAHRAGGALDDEHGVLDVVGVEVGHLGLGDLTHLGLGDRGDLRGPRVRGTLLDAGSLEDEPRSGRGLEDERERAVLVDRDLDRDDLAALRLGRGVVGLAELHDVDAVLTQRRPDGRSGVGGAGLDLELDQACDLLLGRHCFGSLRRRVRIGSRPWAGGVVRLSSSGSG